jgi:2-dehydropantoate 2-reductase
MTGKMIAILGAGAMGSAYAARFAEAPDCKTVLVARGERRDRLAREGIVVNDVTYRLSVVHPEEVAEPADLILVALKHHHLPGAVGDLRVLVGPETTILSVMNGLDSEEILGAVYGMDKVLYTVAVGIDAVREGNRVTHTKPGTLYFGEATNDPPSERVRRVGALLDRAGIAHETPPDMIRTLWWKFMINVGVNQASAVMRAPYGTFQISPEAQALMETLMREVIVLAEAEGVDLGEQDIRAWYDFMNGLSPEGKTSMLQDVEAGRKTEVEMFAGKVVELGAKRGIATPVNETLLHIIHVLEEQAGTRRTMDDGR